jgi:hypothetical protein
MIFPNKEAKAIGVAAVIRADLGNAQWGDISLVLRSPRRIFSLVGGERMKKEKVVFL